MKRAESVALILLLGLLAGSPASAQQTPPTAAEPPTIASVLNTQLAVVEFEIVATAHVHVAE